MSTTLQRGKQFFANRMHREIFWLVFLAAFVPTVITSVSLFYLILSMTAEQLAIPEAIAYNILPAAQRVTAVLLIAIPTTTVILLVFAYQATHRIVGPFDRIVRELQAHAQGAGKGPIVIRKNDKFVPLVTQINALLAQLRKS